jgi:hypothetical protein
MKKISPDNLVNIINLIFNILKLTIFDKLLPNIDHFHFLF